MNRPIISSLLLLIALRWSGPAWADPGSPESLTGPRTERSLRVREILDTLDLRADLLAARDLGKDVLVPETQAPLSGSCWQMDRGGIDWRWSGPSVPSPAEKFAALWLNPAAAVQLRTQLRDHHGRDAEGARVGDGICPGWVASAILAPSPGAPILVKRVRRGARVLVEHCTVHDRQAAGGRCVPFLPSDLQALAAELYSSPEAMALGTGCAHPAVNFTPDRHGKIAQPSQCDNDAATLFVLATNLIGRGRLAFAVMRDQRRAAAWTQPVYGYRMRKYEKVDERDAAAQVGGQGRARHGFRPRSRGFRHVVMEIYLSAPAAPTPGRARLLGETWTQELVLELDERGAILAGQWVGGGRGEHPTGYWMPLGPGTTAPFVTIGHVHGLLNLSRADPRGAPQVASAGAWR